MCRGQGYAGTLCFSQYCCEPQAVLKMPSIKHIPMHYTNYNHQDLSLLDFNLSLLFINDLPFDIT